MTATKLARDLAPGDLVMVNEYPVELIDLRFDPNRCCVLAIWGDGDGEWQVLPGWAPIAVLSRPTVALWSPKGVA